MSFSCGIHIISLYAHLFPLLVPTVTIAPILGNFRGRGAHAKAEMTHYTSLSAPYTSP